MEHDTVNGPNGTVDQTATTVNGLEVHLPRAVLEQDEEYCIVVQNGHERKIRFHDYGEIYKIPGLYEHLFYDRLRCKSPDTVSSMLVEELAGAECEPADLTVLELGAGNGVAGASLASRGVESIVGIDIAKEAEEAARRDRPEVYERYYVEDLTALPVPVREELEATDFNCLMCVAALGFGDIPPTAFAAGYNLIVDGGWVALNIKESFINDDDSSGFSRLIGELTRDEKLEIKAARSYRHRLSLGGDPLSYVAVIGRKLGEAVL